MDGCIVWVVLSSAASSHHNDRDRGRHSGTLWTMTRVRACRHLTQCSDSSVTGDRWPTLYGPRQQLYRKITNCIHSGTSVQFWGTCNISISCYSRALFQSQLLNFLIHHIFVAEIAGCPFWNEHCKSNTFFFFFLQRNKKKTTTKQLIIHLYIRHSTWLYLKLLKLHLEQ